MVFLAGTRLVVVLRLLGFAHALPMSATERFNRRSPPDRLPHQGVASRKTALLAITSIVLWLPAITAGRLLPYTYHRLLFDYPAE